MILGDSEDGKSWCVKALHPSDPLSEVRGIPDRNATPSVFMNYQTTVTVAPVAGAVGTWEVEMSVIPHPIGLMWSHVTDSVGNRFATHLNAQIPGADHAAKIIAFRRLAQRWRLAYMAVSIHQDGPDLANQGTVVACQAPVQAHRMHWSTISNLGATVAHGPIAIFEDTDIPKFEHCESMPNAYFNNSKYGVYMPLKLTRSCQNWRSGRDDILLHTGTVETDPPPSNIDISFAVLPTNGTDLNIYPFPDMVAAGFNPATYGISGRATSDFCNDNWGFICCKNMAVTTSLTVFIRAGYEIQALPGTSLTPQQRLPPPGDIRALESYFAISRELKDAYPVDFNDLGQIWDVISQIAKTVAPALGAIPGIGTGLSMAVGGAAGLGDSIRAAVARSQNASKGDSGKTASAGDIEMARRVVQASAPPLPPRPAASNGPRSIPRPPPARTRKVRVKRRVR
jgi:hypothetical protein